MIYVRIRQLEVKDLDNPKYVRQISDLIYSSNDYIYPDLFGSKRNARKILKVWMRELYCTFSASNMIIAERKGKIIGVIVSVNLADDSAFSIPNLDLKFPKTFKKVQDEVQKPDMKEGKFIVALAVRRLFRNNHIGDMLEDHVSFSSTVPLYCDVLKSNLPMMRLCEKMHYECIGKDIAYGGVETVMHMKRKALK